MNIPQELRDYMSALPHGMLTEDIEPVGRLLTLLESGASTIEDVSLSSWLERKLTSKAGERITGLVAVQGMLRVQKAAHSSKP